VSDLDGWLVFGLAAGAVGFVRFFIHHYSDEEVARRGLRNARHYPIHAFPKGRVGRIVGAVRYADRTLEAPISGRTCAAYVVRVHGPPLDGKGGSARELLKEIKACPFFVEDTTGRAVVSPALATIALTVDTAPRSGLFNDAAGRVEKLLRRHGQGSSGILFHKNLRFEESALEEDDLVAIYGQGHHEIDPDPDPSAAARGNYRDRATRLVIEPTRSGRLYISDAPSTLDLSGSLEQAGPRRYRTPPGS
jgi:hypothetical protein